MIFSGANIHELLAGTRDVRATNHLNPIASITLYAMALTRSLQGLGLNTVSFHVAKVKNYAKDLGVLRAVNDDAAIAKLAPFNDKTVVLKKDHSTAIGLSVIACKDRNKAISSADVIMSKLIPNVDNRQKLVGLNNAISESLQNVYDHTEFRSAAIAFQRAKTQPEFGELQRLEGWGELNRFALFSPGTTLAQSIHLGQQKPTTFSDSDAAYVSVLPGVSARSFFANGKFGSKGESEINSGLGLFLMMRLGARLGRFTLISGKACFRAEGTDTPTMVTFDSSINGVIISIEALSSLSSNSKTQLLCKQIASECDVFFQRNLAALKGQAVSVVAKSAPKLLQEYLENEKSEYGVI